MNWSHPDPMFLDFETQSAADIKEVSGRQYSEHASTRILILACYFSGEYHIWIPDHIRINTSTWGNHTHCLWPYEIKPTQSVTLHRGTECPARILQATNNRPIVAHNAYGFDRFIWNRFIGLDCEWLDSMLVARAACRPGGLDALGQALLGQGKDRAKKLLPLLCTAKPSTLFDGWSYPLINAGDLQAFTRYAVGDVEILRKLWLEFETVGVEDDVIGVHDIINNRGVMVDVNLLRIIQRLSEFSVENAANEIAELTNGRLNKNNLRSIKQVHEWLDSYGVYITDDNGKPCLRKEIVQRYIDSPYLIESNMSSATEIPPVVMKVMELRLKALRITDAKVNRAINRVSADSRIRDLFAYYQAGPGRWSSFGVQIHNLPRPIKGINTEQVIERLSELKSVRDIRVIYEEIRGLLPKSKTDGRGYTERTITVDDTCSTLIRPVFIPKPKHKFVLCDFSLVEVCGGAWVADEGKLLKILREHKDPYKEFAVKLFGLDSIKNVTKDQRQVAKSAVLGAQYGIGPNKMGIYAANMGADLAAAGVTREQLVDTFRDTYSRICGFKPDKNQNFRTGGIWHKLDKATKDCVLERRLTEAGKCTFHMEGRNMLCTLPSGRSIYYPEIRMEDVIPPYCYTLNLPLNPKATLVYTSPRGPKALYGGLIFENIIQGMCRDLLAVTLIQLEEEGLNTVIHVHDEPVCEVPEEKANDCLIRMVEIMSTVPQWAEGFPLSCEGFISPRFVKEPFEGFKKLHSKDLIQSKGMPHVITV